MIKLRKKTLTPVTVAAQLLRPGMRLEDAQLGTMKIVEITRELTYGSGRNVTDILYWVKAANFTRSVELKTVYRFDQEVNVLVKI